MRQRLGIAQALLGWREFIILDEPTSGLDPQGIKEVRELIRRLSAERSMTIFVSSHLLNEIEQTATSMAIINEAKMLFKGKYKTCLVRLTMSQKSTLGPIEKAINLIEGQRFVYGVKRNGQFLEVRMPLQQVSSLNVQLVNAGLEVHALIPRLSLEEYFLSINEQTSSVPVSPQDACIDYPDCFFVACGKRYWAHYRYDDSDYRLYLSFRTYRLNSLQRSVHIYLPPTSTCGNKLWRSRFPGSKFSLR